MSKAANALQKSHKTLVVVCRILLKTSLVSVILTAYFLCKGAALAECALPLTLAVCAAISYAFFYYLHKSGSYVLENNHSIIFLQIKLMLRIIIFFTGAAIFIWSSENMKSEPFKCLPLMSLGLLMCQLLHNNKKLTSHLSTFCENMAAAMLALAMLNIYNYSESVGSPLQIILCLACVPVLMILQEIFFHEFNKEKHPDYNESNKKTEVILRIQTAIRNIIIAIIVTALWSALVELGGIKYIAGAWLYDTIIGLLPITISITTLCVLLYNNFFKKVIVSAIKYDFSPKPKDFRKGLRKHFMVFDEDEIKKVRKSGAFIPADTPCKQLCLAESALDYVIEKMSAEAGYTRTGGEPYYTHPIAVANILMDLSGASAEMLATALLHDCIEDVPECTEEIIRAKFGDAVTESVLLLTKSTGTDYHNRGNMMEYLFKILSDPIASAVKAADRMHNNSTMDSRLNKIPYKDLETKELYIPFVDFAALLHKDNERFFNIAKEFFSAGIPLPEDKKNEVKAEPTEEEADIDVPEC